MKLAVITENGRSLDLKQDVFKKLYLVTHVPLLLEHLDLNFPHCVISCFRKGEMNIMNLAIIQGAVNTKEINRKKRYSNEKKKHVLKTVGMK